MSSPIALERRAASRQALVNLHQNLSHGRRVRTLAAALANHIRTLTGDTQTRCLDVGCGDMTIAEAVHALALNTDWRCIDVHPLPERLADDARWRKYRPFDGRTIPYSDSEFDVAVICDVLHHTPDNAASLLREAARVARYVLLKDHFEYGRYSRSMLRLMDFVGNWGYGISVPERYFTRSELARLAASQQLTIDRLDVGLELYSHLPVVRSVLRPSWQFIAVLRRA